MASFQTCTCDYWYYYIYSNNYSIRCWIVSVRLKFICLKFLFSRIGAIFLRNRVSKGDRLSESGKKIREDEFTYDTWAGEGSWRLGHRILGALVLALGLVNISLGVFLAVLPLAVWIIWFIYLGFLVLILLGMEIVALLRRRGGGAGKSGSLKIPGKTK